MIFKEKSSVIIYFEECLINPPTFPGTSPTEKYLDQVTMEFISGYRTLEEVSEIVGEVWGTMCANVVIAGCIASVARETCTKSEAKTIDKLFDKLITKQNQLKQHSPTQLYLNLVSDGAAKSLRYLIDAGQANTVLQSELSVGKHIQDIRFNALKQFAPSALREYLYDGIESLTGFRPTN
jgi:hypothetical protein